MGKVPLGGGWFAQTNSSESRVVLHVALGCLVILAVINVVSEGGAVILDKLTNPLLCHLLSGVVMRQHQLDHCCLLAVVSLRALCAMSRGCMQAAV